MTFLVFEVLRIYFVLASSFFLSFYLIRLFRALSFHLYCTFYVCPLVTCLPCVFLLRCPSASAPCCFMVPEHNTVLRNVPVLLVQTSPGMWMSASSHTRVKAEQWEPETGTRWITRAARKHHGDRLLHCGLHVANAVINFHVTEAISESGHLYWLLGFKLRATEFSDG